MSQSKPKSEQLNRKAKGKKTIKREKHIPDVGSEKKTKGSGGK